MIAVFFNIKLSNVCSLFIELTPKEWLSGKNRSLEKMSLDPSKRENGDKPIVVVCIILILLQNN
jgi:hypothetical protein